MTLVAIVREALLCKSKVLLDFRKKLILHIEPIIKLSHGIK